MEIVNTFSKRENERNEGQESDSSYESIPVDFRVQIIHIFKELSDYIELPPYDPKLKKRPEMSAWWKICRILRKEHATFELGENTILSSGSYEMFKSYFLSLKETPKVLDVIEVTFCEMKKYCTGPDGWIKSVFFFEAVDELNARFEELNIEYRFQDMQIVRIDSALMYHDVIGPCIKLLRESRFKGVQMEFLSAQKHFKNGDFKATLIECLKALESVIKVIAVDRNWEFPDNANARALINMLFEKKLIPSIWKSHFSSLQNMLESGIPTARNKLAGHGQGDKVIEVPLFLASFIINISAATILFIADADVNLPMVCEVQ